MTRHPSDQHPAPAPWAGVAPDPWAWLGQHTPARVGLGRSGVSLPTQAWLAFAAAHAQARDAVHLPLDEQALADQLQAVASHVTRLRVQSAAPDRAAYLLRPDWGRRLSRDSALLLDQAPDRACDLLLVLADGLSAAALMKQAPSLLAELLRQQPAGWRLGPLVLATQARVALGDDIGARLGARQVAVLIGERPGLSSPDSLGIYLTHAPRVGCTDAQRNCISNVRDQGLSAAEAARKLWWLAQAAQRSQVTGVALKDQSDLAPGLSASP
jgi:ethanolamine ammonia-lyase small subunit